LPKGSFFLVVALLPVLTGLALAADQQEMPAQDPSAQLNKEHDITL